MSDDATSISETAPKDEEQRKLVPAQIELAPASLPERLAQTAKPSLSVTVAAVTAAVVCAVAAVSFLRHEPAPNPQPQPEPASQAVPAPQSQPAPRPDLLATDPQHSLRPDLWPQRVAPDALHERPELQPRTAQSAPEPEPRTAGVTGLAGGPRPEPLSAPESAPQTQTAPAGWFGGWLSPVKHPFVSGALQMLGFHATETAIETRPNPFAENAPAPSRAPSTEPAPANTPALQQGPQAGFETTPSGSGGTTGANPPTGIPPTHPMTPKANGIAGGVGNRFSRTAVRMMSTSLASLPPARFISQQIRQTPSASSQNLSSIPFCQHRPVAGQTALPNLPFCDQVTSQQSSSNTNNPSNPNNPDTPPGSSGGSSGSGVATGGGSQGNDSNGCSGSPGAAAGDDSGGSDGGSGGGGGGGD